MRPRRNLAILLTILSSLGLASCGPDDAEEEKDPPYSQKVMRAEETARIMNPDYEEPTRKSTAASETGESENSDSDESDIASEEADENPMDTLETSQPPNESAESENVEPEKEPANSGEGKQPTAKKQRETDRKDDKAKDGAIEPRHKALLAGLTIFVLAIFVGFEVITKVPPTLHTPLMSGSNAISGITLVGAVTVTGMGTAISLAAFTGFIAIVLATINVVGGFFVTHRMLSMFKKR